MDSLPSLAGGVFRSVAPAVLAYLVGKGVIPAADYGPLLAGLGAVAAAAWSIWVKKKTAASAAPSA